MQIQIKPQFYIKIQLDMFLKHNYISKKIHHIPHTAKIKLRLYNTYENAALKNI